VLLREVIHLARPTIVRLEHWLTARARTHAAHPAVETPRGTLTYAELDAAAAAAARRLAARGVGRGDRVAVALEPGLGLAALVHAVPKLGAALVPLNPAAPPAELDRLTTVAGAHSLLREMPDGDEADVELETESPVGDGMLVVLTSGTTGQPRPVELSLGNIQASALASSWNLGVDPEDRWLAVLPLFHIGGLSILTRSAVYGTTAVIHDSFDADRVRDALEDGGITLASFVPTMLRRLRDAGLEQAPRLRAALLGGGPVPPDLLEWARGLGLPVIPTYGMTETCSQVATQDPEEALAGERGARPLEGAEIEIGAGGEILVRGAMVAAGALAEDGWLHTGDVGQIDAAGRLHVVGRLKDIIVTGGENVAPAEVEGVLQAHPAVTDSGVIGVPDPEWGEAVTAYVVLRSAADPAELIAHCASALSGYKVPKAIHVVDALPRNAAGKLIRGELPG
jgi:O-succinylbenzoic acid--CoA ligase